ncbi:MAG: hypothetical protein HQL67_01995 [Magnetococcales bacterium]|nr:hypothetical protein [Magnetococcales bacterium]
MKIFVILAGVVIVVGSGILFTRLYSKFHGATEPSSTPKTLETHILLPPSAELSSLAPMGDGVAVLVKESTGAGQLLLINQAGQLWRRVHLEPTPAVDANDRSASRQSPEN